ncbi:hypothetical protein LBMAG24_23110 [Bacteroidota bacterium]|nr:hypothetical protein LBMAG24_23110 [Bacteroidota bacterium]
MGVPLIVITLDNQTAVTPAGKFVAVPIPVAPVVAIVIDEVKAVFTESVGLDDAVAAVLRVQDVTVIVPVAFTLPQPPVKGIT